MTNWRDGSINFEQRGVEFPDVWSVNAANIVTTKYFRGAVGTPEREWSLKQLIDRVVTTYRKAGEEHGYFATPARRRGLRPRADLDAAAPGVQLQLAGLVQRRHRRRRSRSAPASSSSVDDSMDSILDWYKEEGLIFKGGSGSGVNLSRIRSSKELLSSGGTASGPVSFMRGADASAGTIKSGGATRRAAKMVILDVDHPDIEEFVVDQGARGGQDPRAARRRLRHGPRRHRHRQRAVPERQQLGPGLRRVHARGRGRRRLRPARPARRRRSSRPSTPRSCSARSPRPPGSAPTPACSTTTRSTTGTPTRRPAGSPRRNPCSEYMHLDNSSCNLASLNLMKFLRADGGSRWRSSSSRSSSSSPRWTSRSASPTSRPRRSARPPGPTGSSASATPTSARC